MSRNFTKVGIFSSHWEIDSNRKTQHRLDIRGYVAPHYTYYSSDGKYIHLLILFDTTIAIWFIRHSSINVDWVANRKTIFCVCSAHCIAIEKNTQRTKNYHIHFFLHCHLYITHAHVCVMQCDLFRYTAWNGNV